MSGFYKIKDTSDKWYNDLKEIYSVSFPVYEQRNHIQQEYAFSDNRYNLFCLIDEKEHMLCAFISFWEFEQYIYIEHLAVNEKLRGRDIGTKMLQKFKDETTKTIILEIDPLVDDISEKRLRFYQRLGFKLNTYQHYHPPYDTRYQPHQLRVLSTGEELSPELYGIFKEDLENVVMRTT